MFLRVNIEIFVAIIYTYVHELYSLESASSQLGGMGRRLVVGWLIELANFPLRRLRCFTNDAVVVAVVVCGRPYEQL